MVLKKQNLAKVPTGPSGNEQLKHAASNSKSKAPRCFISEDRLNEIHHRVQTYERLRRKVVLVQKLLLLAACASLIAILLTATYQTIHNSRVNQMFRRNNRGPGSETKGKGKAVTTTKPKPTPPPPPQRAAPIFELNQNPESNFPTLVSIILDTVFKQLIIADQTRKVCFVQFQTEIMHHDHDHDAPATSGDGDGDAKVPQMKCFYAVKFEQYQSVSPLAKNACGMNLVMNLIPIGGPCTLVRRTAFPQKRSDPKLQKDKEDYVYNLGSIDAKYSDTIVIRHD